MSKYVSRGLALVLFTGGLTLLGAGIANAADTTGDEGLLSGTQIVAPITAPVEAAGNAVSVLGDALAGGTSTPAPAPAPAPATAPAPAPAPAPVSTSGADSVLGGTQAVVEAAAPVTVQGNAISVAGDSAATSVPAPAAPVAEPAAPAAAPTTSGSDAIASGTQVLPTVSVPVNLGGNAISVLGDSSAEGASAPAATTSTGSGDATTSGSDGVAGGTQVLPTVSVPVNVGGNAISVLGDSTSEGASAPAATTGSSTGSTGGATTTGSDSVAGGTQIAPDVALPVSVGGNAISILGDAASTGSSTPAAQEGTDGGVTTTGDDGILGGTQVVPSVTLPVTIGGNAISVLGDSAVTGGATGAVAPADPTDPIDPTDPVLPTGPTAGSNGTGGSTVVATGFTGGGTAAALGSATTAALSVQALASTGADIAPLVGLIGLLLAAGIALLVIARRRTV